MGELTALPNIGPKLEEQLAAVGVTTVDELKNVGSRAAWLRILAIDDSACAMRLYALEDAVRGVNDRFLDAETKKDLKAFYKQNKNPKKA
jgi:DNA transformation protein